MGVLDQQYELVPVSELQAHPDNPRRGDVGAVQSSVQENGFYGTLVVQRKTGYVLAGNHRLQAAKREGIETLPVVYVDVDDERARRILLVDNRANDLASYDVEQLVALLGELPDLGGTGYSVDDLAGLVEQLEPAGATGNLPDDEAQSDTSGLYQYGVIVMCADEEEQERTYETLQEQGFRLKVVTT